MNNIEFFIESLVSDLIIFSIFAIPVLVLAFFTFSLVRFIVAAVKRKIKTSHTVLLVISTVMLAVLAAVVIGFVALLYLAVAYM